MTEHQVPVCHACGMPWLFNTWGAPPPGFVGDLETRITLLERLLREGYEQDYGTPLWRQRVSDALAKT